LTYHKLMLTYEFPKQTETGCGPSVQYRSLVSVLMDFVHTNRGK